jgi:hypothetical protein
MTLEMLWQSGIDAGLPFSTVGLEMQDEIQTVLDNTALLIGENNTGGSGLWKDL